MPLRNWNSNFLGNLQEKFSHCSVKEHPLYVNGKVMRATTCHKKTVSKDAFNISLTNVQSQWTIPNFLVNGIHCSVLRHLKNMFYMSNERSWLQPLFTKWSCQIMFSIIRNNIWERIRCQTLHIFFTAVKSGILTRIFWRCYQMNSWPLSSISFVSSPNGTYLLFVCRDW